MCLRGLAPSDREPESKIECIHHNHGYQSWRSAKRVARKAISWHSNCHQDLFETRGIRTTAVRGFFENYIPTEDAVVVRKLKAAGAIIMGKTNTHELALGVTTVNPHYGACHNPWIKIEFQADRQVEARLPLQLVWPRCTWHRYRWFHTYPSFLVWCDRP